MADEARKLTRQELAQKIRWEGGLWATLEYGLRADEISDPDLVELWARLVKGYEAIAPALEEAAAKLDVAA